MGQNANLSGLSSADTRIYTHIYLHTHLHTRLQTALDEGRSDGEFFRAILAVHRREFSEVCVRGCNVFLLE